MFRGFVRPAAVSLFANIVIILQYKPQCDHRHVQPSALIFTVHSTMTANFLLSKICVQSGYQGYVCEVWIK